MNNSSMIMVKYRGPTNTLPSRIELQTWDLSHYNNSKVCRKTLNYDHRFNGADGVAENYFKEIGLEIIGTNSRHPEVYVYLFKWNIELMATIFGYEEQVK